jgi:nitrite reductase (NO-forming)
MTRAFSVSDTLRRTSAPVVVAAAVFLVGGCGGGGGQAAGPTTSTGTTSTGSTSAGSTSVAGAVLNFNATEYSFTPSALKASAGKTTIRLTDSGAEGHDFAIDALHVHITSAPGKTADATVILRPGTYTFYCSIPGHLQSGMQGKLTVS